MTAPSFTLHTAPTAALAMAAMKTPASGVMPRVRGMGWVTGLKLLNCVMLGFGALGFGIALEWVVSGQTRITPWTCAIGVVLFYLAVFGAIFLSWPAMVRSVMATRLNQGPLTITLDAEGITNRSAHFESQIKWAGIEGLGRNKLALVLFIGGNRLSLPFDAMDRPDEVEAAIARWLAASR